MNHTNVCGAVVSADLCIGCGVCVAFCPSRRLEIGWDARGLYRPSSTGRCPDGCSVCLGVCPFATGRVAETEIGDALFGEEDGVSHCEEIGRWSSAWVGHVAEGDYRAEGASGGLATWLLNESLRKGIAEQVLCVGSTGRPGELFSYGVVEDPTQIARMSKSAYYPVTLAAALSQVLKSERRTTIIALPCFVTALRLAQRSSRELQSRIVLVVGLTCGQTRARGFAEYVAAKSGIAPEDLQRIVFRQKSPEGLGSGLPNPDGGRRSQCDDPS